MPARHVNLVTDTFGVETFGIVERLMQLLNETQVITMLRPDDITGEVDLVGSSPHMTALFCARTQSALGS